ncbi:MAG: excinuclease ABC subunit A [Tabrizicola sp.]|nr:excinuclease ABC subunit A [Tabrizicola sp.]
MAATLAAPAEAKNDKHCPPGLAKKAVPCVPPGQAKKSQGDEHEHHYDWRRGDRIQGDYVLIPRDEWERLALRDYRDDSTYLRIDNQILRVVRDTLIVIEAVRILDRVLE